MVAQGTAVLPGASAERVTARTRSLIWLTVLTGLALRLFRLDAWQIGLDEAYSAKVAAMPLRRLLEFVATDDFHPPLYYLVLRAWSQLGSGETWLRLLSVAFGVASIWVVYRLGENIGTKRIGIVAAAILALSPLHIYYAQEARMYSMLFFLSSTSLLLFWRIINNNGTRATWIAYVVVTLAAVYTHYGALAILAGQNLAVALLVVARQRIPLKAWLVSQGALLLGFAPWISMLERDAGNTAPAAGVGLPFGQVAFTVAGFVSYLLPSGSLMLKAAAVAVYGTAALAGILLLRERRGAIVLFCSSLAVLGAAAVIGQRFAEISAGTSVLIPRTLLAASAGFYVGIAVAIVQPRRRVVGSMLLAGLIALNLAAYPQLYRTARSGPWREVAGYVASGLLPGDALIFVSGHWARAFDYYFLRQDRPMPYVRYIGVQDLERVKEATSSATRVWLIVKQVYAADPHQRVEALLSTWGRVEDRRGFPYGIRVSRYGRAMGTAPPQEREGRP